MKARMSLRHKFEATFTEASIEDLILLKETSLDHAHEALEKRFKGNKIYTKIGNVLISVNPFASIDGLYDPFIIPLFQNRYMHEMQPHIFSLAEDTYRAMLRGKEDQCIIITGESGSGKTEASKKIMQYIAAVSGNSDEIIRVKDQLLKSNPVLEAFGNAKTLRNDNSSRFGKYLEIFFDPSGDPVGGNIRNYLLEKNRVVNAAKGERNFHIFYLLTQGSSESFRDKFHLKDSNFYSYLKCTEVFSISEGRDAREFKELRDGFKALGITDDEEDQLFSIISAVLWLGQIEFEGEETACLAKSSDKAVEIVAELLKIDLSLIKTKMCQRETKGTGSEVIKRFLTPSEAQSTRDALSKLIYQKCFDWILQRINRAIKPESKKNLSIGVLDIYGFEIFENNSFEQFCINFVNEKLQQVFIEQTLRREQEEYASEGIQWTPVDYFDNKIVCELMEGSKGIYKYLDESCLVPKGSDKHFHEKIVKELDSHAHFTKPTVKSSDTSFIINHYAGQVEYEANGFLEKNKDLVWADLVALGESSELSLMNQMFPEGSASSLGSKRPDTAGKSFVAQVHELVSTLSRCVPHYIRCMKPNDQKKSKQWDTDRMKHQITYLGLVENIRVCRAGFAFRQHMDKFVQRYKLVHELTWPTPTENAKETCALILGSVGMKEGHQFQFGKTKLFIKEPQSLFTLEALLQKKIPLVVAQIQALWKGFHDRLLMDRNAKVTKIQAFFKGQRARVWYNKEFAAITIQSHARRMIQERRYDQMKSAHVIVKVVRNFLELKEPIGLKLFEKELLRDKKDPRKVSVNAFPVGFYLPEITSELLEKILENPRKSDSSPFAFCDMGEKFGKNGFKVRLNRVFVLSQKCFYDFEWTNLTKLRQAQKKGNSSIGPTLRLHRCVSFNEIKGIALSTKKDNVVVIRTKRKEKDLVLMLERKSEFVSILVSILGGSKCPLEFKDEIEYVYKGKTNKITFKEGNVDGFTLERDLKSSPPGLTVISG